MSKRPDAQYGRVQRVERGARGHGPTRDSAGFHGLALAREAEDTRPPPRGPGPQAMGRTPRPCDRKEQPWTPCPTRI